MACIALVARFKNTCRSALAEPETRRQTRVKVSLDDDGLAGSLRFQQVQRLRQHRVDRDRLALGVIRSSEVQQATDDLVQPSYPANPPTFPSR